MEKIKAEQPKEQTKEKEPQLSFDFFYFVHQYEKDFPQQKLKKKLKEADIFCPETAGWKKSLEGFLNMVSQGKADKQKIEKFKQEAASTPELTKKFLETLTGSSKIVKLIDLPEEHPLYLKIKKAYNDLANAYAFFLRGDKAAITLGREAIEKIAELQKAREAYMQEQLIQELPGFIKKQPNLRNKKAVKILVFLGALHTSLHHKLRRQGKNASLSFGQPLFLYDRLEGVLIRKKIYHPDKELGDTEIAEAFMEKILADYLSRFDKDTQKLISVTSYIQKQRPVSEEDLSKLKDTRAIAKFYADLLPRNKGDFNKLWRKAKHEFLPQN